jgi:hypothetical protein
MRWGLAVLLFLAASSPVAAQATPTLRSTPDAGHYIPVGRQIAEEWEFSGTFPLDREGTSLASAYAGTYGGPHGYRAYIAAWEGDGSEQSRDAAWSSGGDAFDALQVFAFEPFDGSEAQNAGDPLPDGCFAVRRVTGVVTAWAMPSAAILCATERDVVVLVVIAGLLPQMGAMASAEAILVTSLEKAREIQG